MLDWFRDPALRRRVQAGLNEAKPACAGACGIYTDWEKSGQKTRIRLSRQWTDAADGCHIPCGLPSMERAVDA